MTPSSDQAATKALERFAAGANCAESVLRALQQTFDLPEEVAAGALGFGGGIGRCQAVCGAISGCVIALSHAAAAKAGSEQEARSKAGELARKLYKEFQAEFARTDCRTLSGYDFQVPGGYEAFHQRDVEAGARFCNRYVEYAVKTAMELAEGT